MMAAAYSLDLRRKIVEAYERGSRSQAEIADVFGVSLAFVEKLLRQYRETGELEPVRHRAGRHPLLNAAACEQLHHWLDEQSDLTLAELADRLQTQFGLCVSLSGVWRALRRLGLRRKKRLSMPASATRHRYYWHASNTTASLPLAQSTASNSLTNPAAILR
jgi:transposase